MSLSEKQRNRNFRNPEFFWLILNTYFRIRWAKPQRGLLLLLITEGRSDVHVYSWLSESLFYFGCSRTPFFFYVTWSSIQTKVRLQKMRILKQSNDRSWKLKAEKYRIGHFHTALILNFCLYRKNPDRLGGFFSTLSNLQLISYSLYFREINSYPLVISGILSRQPVFLLMYVYCSLKTVSKIESDIIYLCLNSFWGYYAVN